MKLQRIMTILLAVSLPVFLNYTASADGFDCDAMVIDVVLTRVEKSGADLAEDVYIAARREMEITRESVFEVLRPTEVNEEPVRHYPLMLSVGRLKIIDMQDEVLIGRMIEFASDEEHPRLRYKTVMIGDCLRLEEEAKGPEEEVPLTVEQGDLPAEVLDISGLKFPGTRASEHARIIPSKVLFKFDSAVVEDKWADDLAQLAEYIAMERPAKIVVEGHACRIGADEYNQKLSERRARAVINHLATRHGLDRDIFEIEAYGESRPAVSNETVQGRRKNRRAVTLALFKAIPTTRASAASSDWPLAVRPEELAPEDVGIPVIPSEPPDEEDLIEEF